MTPLEGRGQPLVSIRDRISYTARFPARKRTWDKDTLLSDTTSEGVVTGRQETVSKNRNPRWRRLNEGKAHLRRRLEKRYDPHLAKSLRILENADVGGYFYTATQLGYSNSKEIHAFANVTERKSCAFDGYLALRMTGTVSHKNPLWPALASEQSLIDSLLAKGTVAISRTIPTVPVTSLATFFGELRNDGIPDLIGSIALRAGSGFKRTLTSGGSEYLNYQFGWKPFVSDLLGVAKAVSRSAKILDDYTQRSGRNIGRSYSFPTELTTSEEDIGLLVPAPSMPDTRMYLGPYSLPTMKVVEREQRVWFEGVYCYHLPTASDAAGKVRLYAAYAEHLLGITPTVEVIWNLAPWSWFADWFFNYGAIATNLSNLSAKDCVIRRGYIMCTTREKHTYTHPGVTIAGYGPTGALSESFQTTSKMRLRASPYGFGPTFVDFSPRQLAILAALGITQGLDHK